MSYHPLNLNLPFDHKVVSAHHYRTELAVVLVDRGNDRRLFSGRFATFRAQWDAEAKKWDCFWGHYMQDLDEARCDFAERIRGA